MSTVAAVEPILMRTGQYEFGVSDFEHVYFKNNLNGKQSLNECLSLYVPYKLKLIAAREAGLDTLPAITGEWAKYRSQLANKCLIDSIISGHLLSEAFDRSRHELKVAHILLKTSGRDSLASYNKIVEVRQRILDGEDFGQLAELYSDDPSAKVNRGALGWITVFQMEYPFETEAYKTSVGQVSQPVQTKAGYHIIKVYDRRDYNHIKSDETMRRELQQKMMNNDRLWVGIDRFVKKLKERYHFTEDTVLLKNLFCNCRHTNYGDRTLFSFAGRHYSVRDFERFATSAGHARKPSFTTVEQAYGRYVAQSLLEYENENLESNSSEFRDIADEYLNGLLLFGISQREVWSKASQDSAGLADLYRKNPKSYRWGKRLDATVYYCSDQIVATRISLTVNNKNAGLGHLPNGLFTFFCNPDRVNPCIDTIRQVFPKGLKTIADQIKWKKGCSKILEWNGKFVFLDVHDIFRPERKTFNEARAEVIADYQKVLEKRWVEQLKERYPVAIDEVVWADLKKKYAK